MTKTISLADDAYRELVDIRRPRESFSDLARRLAQAEKQRRFLDRRLPPIISDEQADAMTKDMYKSRDESARPRHKWS